MHLEIGLAPFFRFMAAMPMNPVRRTCGLPSESSSSSFGLTCSLASTARLRCLQLRTARSYIACPLRRYATNTASYCKFVWAALLQKHHCRTTSKAGIVLRVPQCCRGATACSPHPSIRDKGLMPQWFVVPWMLVAHFMMACSCCCSMSTWKYSQSFIQIRGSSAS